MPATDGEQAYLPWMEDGVSPALYRDTGYNLNHLVEDIRVGRIGLPDIQRPFVWSPAKARDLFDSLYRGYPVGTLMFWETGADVGTRQIGVDGADRAPQVLVVDGQQRLTALYSVMTGRHVLTKNFDERRITIAFRPQDETFEVADAAIARDPEFVPDITKMWTSGYKTTVRQFLGRLDTARQGELDNATTDLLEERIDRVHDLRDFRFQVVELGATADEEQVAEIFVRINSEGVQLNQSDFILTLMSVHWEKGRKQLEAFSRAAVDPTVIGQSPKNPFIDPSPDQMLRVGVALPFKRARLQLVYNLLRGKDLDTGVVSKQQRDAQFQTLADAQEQVLDLQNWHEFLKCIAVAGFRSRSMVSSENALLFTYAMWLIGRRDFGLDRRTLRRVIARWFFMAHTTNRYTSSPESALESDLRRISDLTPGDGPGFVEELDRIVGTPRVSVGRFAVCPVAVRVCRSVSCCSVDEPAPLCGRGRVSSLEVTRTCRTPTFGSRPRTERGTATSPWTAAALTTIHAVRSRRPEAGRRRRGASAGAGPGLPLLPSRTRPGGSRSRDGPR